MKLARIKHEQFPETSMRYLLVLWERCISCGQHLTADQLAMTPEIECPFCGYRVLRKARPPRTVTMNCVVFKTEFGSRRSNGIPQN
jgi:DNA-directed RNA polymerase subunit RPC12/RpoP